MPRSTTRICRPPTASPSAAPTSSVVVLDYELKREYQEWLHARDRDRDDYNGHPDRTDQEIRDWADDHDLPYFDEQVHFPDLRIECRYMHSTKRKETAGTAVS